MHPIFQIFLLNSVASNPIPSQILPPPLLIEVDNKEKLKVTPILNLRRRRGQIEYYIYWIIMDHATWKNKDNVTTYNTEDILNAFYQRYLTKL